MADYYYFIFDLPRYKSPTLSQEVKNNLNALAQNNYTVSEELPKNPRNGMFRFNASDENDIRLQYYYNGSWRTLFGNLEGGATQARRKAESFASLDTWVFDHNLGLRPVVQVVNASGEVVHPFKIEHSSVDRVTVTHSTAQSGEIIVLG